tara:strand:- start:9618 stop:9764 length:147 start_codon:yes stop_codon:yes gene_type:complete
MLSKGFKEILNDFSNDDLIFLIKSDPYFITDFCYMLSLEIQLDKEAKK